MRTHDQLGRFGKAAAIAVIACAAACTGAPEASPVDPPGPADPPDADTRLGPPYPIVLAHGFFGFETFAGVDFITYFYEVKDDLAAHGETLVFTPEVDPFNDSTVRGQELLAAVEQITRETGYAKVNIIGHSQGGLDARVVASLRPDLVASVTTIGTPHGGTPIADIAMGLLGNDDVDAIVDALVRLIGAPLYDEVGDQTSVVAALEQFSTPGVTAFDVDYPDSPGVRYFSIAGRTALSGGGDDCASADEPPFMAPWDDDRDGVDTLLSVTEAAIGGYPGNWHPNDGLVRAEDAKHGQFLGCIPADHLDEIGQLFGDSPGLLNGFDHQQFYEGLVDWLRAQGL